MQHHCRSGQWEPGLLWSCWGPPPPTQSMQVDERPSTRQPSRAEHEGGRSPWSGLPAGRAAAEGPHAWPAALLLGGSPEEKASAVTSAKCASMRPPLPHLQLQLGSQAGLPAVARTAAVDTLSAFVLSAPAGCQMRWHSEGSMHPGQLSRLAALQCANHCHTRDRGQGCTIAMGL